LRTYSIELTDLFHDLDHSLGSYRHAVSSLIPEMTKVAWDVNKDELTRATPGLTRRRFVYVLRNADYRKEWGAAYDRPHLGTRVLALFIRILPKVGPLKALAFKPPTPETDKLFMASFLRTLAEYRRLLLEVGRPGFRLPNRDFDTGALTRPTEYRMSDDAYSELAVRLAERKPESVDPVLRRNVLWYFSDLNLPFVEKKDPKKWQKTVSAVGELRSKVVTDSTHE
jgi:hypothetical protein